MTDTQIADELAAIDARLRAVPTQLECSAAVNDLLQFMDRNAARILDALRSPEPAQADQVHQWRRIGCSYWYEGHPDPADGGGPYEIRVLYTAPPAQADGGYPEAWWSKADYEEIGICVGCAKPIRPGEVVVAWNNEIGHADCNDPFSMTFPPLPEDSPAPMLLLGNPARYFPLPAPADQQPPEDVVEDVFAAMSGASEFSLDAIGNRNMRTLARAASAALQPHITAREEQARREGRQQAFEEAAKYIADCANTPGTCEHMKIRQTLLLPLAAEFRAKAGEER